MHVSQSKNHTKKNPRFSIIKTQEYPSCNRKKNEKHVEKTCKGWRSMCPFFLLVYTISLCFHKFPPHCSFFELLKSMKSSNFLFIYQIEHLQCTCSILQGNSEFQNNWTNSNPFPITSLETTRLAQYRTCQLICKQSDDADL